MISRRRVRFTTERGIGMKRGIALLLALALLAGCAAGQMYPTDNAYHPETDYPYSMTMELNTKYFAEQEKGYYFYIPNCMFYMDKASMEPVPLCSKPNCLHWEEATAEAFHDCNAYFSAGVRPPMGWFDGNLYLISQVDALEETGIHLQWALLQVAPDGAQRKILYRFSPGAIIETAIIHRGVIYIAVREITENGEVKGSIMAYSLTKPDRKPERIIEIDIFPDNSMQQSLTAYGQRLYFVRYISDEGDRELCIYDLKTKELTQVHGTKDGYSPIYVTFMGDKMLVEYKSYLPQGDPEDVKSYPERIYRCDLEGNGRELLWEDMGFFAADDTYIYRVANLWADKENDHFIHICDADGGEVDRIDLFAIDGAEKLVSASCHVSADDQVLIETSRGGESGLRYYFYWFSKSEIGSGQIQVHPFIDFKNEYSDYRSK